MTADRAGAAAGPPVDARLAAIAARLAAITVELRAGRNRHGSGVVWRSDGLIVTNAHVARGSVTAILADGRALPARLCAWDAGLDLAALDVAVAGLPSAERAGLDALAPGALVLAVGSPWGIRAALSIGLVHAIGGASEVGAPRGLPGASVATWIRAHLRLGPGSSGGPLADAYGRVIGINAMIAGGLALAIPSVEAERVVAAARR